MQLIRSNFDYIFNICQFHKSNRNPLLIWLSLMWNVLSALFIAVFLPILSLFNFLRSLDFNSSGCTTYSTWYFLVSEIDNWFHSLIELNSWCERNWISDYKPNMHFRTSVHIMWYASNVASSNNSSNNKKTATKKNCFYINSRYIRVDIIFVWFSVGIKWLHLECS